MIKQNRSNQKNRIKRMALLLLMISLAGVTPYLLAAKNPRGLSTDQRIKVVAYERDNVVPIHGSTLISTQIIFGENEKIIDAQGGDAAAWTLGVEKDLPNIINIKPTISDSHSNLTVITVDDQLKRRFYRFELIAESHDSSKDIEKTYSLEFIYPNDNRAKLLANQDFARLQKKAILNASKHPRRYNWNYRFSGARSIMPLHVFDDGKFTYFQLRHNQSVPAIFAVNNAAGYESLVNTRRVDDYLIVQQIAPQFTLRSGPQAVASVFNARMIQSIRGKKR